MIDVIVRFLEWVFYGIHYKKIYVQVRPCANGSTHGKHAWTTDYKYGPQNRSYYCEGK